MKLKSTLFAGLLAASLSVPAFASDAYTATPLPQFSAADTQMLFAQDAMPMQLAALSQQEMMETEGAWFFLGFAAIGGGFGGMNYASSVPRHQRTTRGWTMAVGSGAAAGAITRIPMGQLRATAHGGFVGFGGNHWATSSWGRW